jgi:circadian clock protein KaiC
MRSAGIDLAPWVEQSKLLFHAERPSRHGLETHLVMLHRAVEKFKPDVVVVDPITNLLMVGTQIDVRAMLTRIIDFLKTRNITAVFTSLTATGVELDSTQTMISSLMDTWVMTSTEQDERRRHRWIYVLKSRGMAHSDEMREFQITGTGVRILPGQKRAIGE